jgi:hypothetical protein
VSDKLQVEQIQKGIEECLTASGIGVFMMFAPIGSMLLHPKSAAKAILLIDFCSIGGDHDIQFVCIPHSLHTKQMNGRNEASQ